MLSHDSFYLYFPKTTFRKVEHFFMCLMAIHMFSFWIICLNILCVSLLDYISLLDYLFIIKFLSSYVSWIGILWQIHVVWVFFPRLYLSYSFSQWSLLMSCCCCYEVASVDGSPPGSPIPGILQARTLEWVAISFSNAGKWKWSRSVVSNWSRPHGPAPTRLLRPWDFPGNFCF